MPTLAELIHDPARSGVYRVTSKLPEQPALIRIDGRRHADKASLLAALGKALHFPDYYGENWDALEECLADMSWWTGPVVVLIEQADALEHDTREMLIDVWLDAAMAADGERVYLLLLEGVEPEEYLTTVTA